MAANDPAWSGFVKQRFARNAITPTPVVVDGQVVESPATLVDPSKQVLRVDRKEIASAVTRTCRLHPQ